MPSGDIFKMGQSYEADLLAQARGHARTMQWVAVAAIAMFALCALGLVFIARRRVPRTQLAQGWK